MQGNIIYIPLRTAVAKNLDGLQKLDLACLPHLHSIDLVGLLPTDADPKHSPLETLILDNTGIDDDAAVFISSCPMLKSLEVAGTKITSMQNPIHRLPFF